MEPIFNPCGEFRWSPEGPVSQIHSPPIHVGAPGIFSDLLRFVQMRKREWGAESNGKLSHLSIPSKTAAWVSEFAVEDLPLRRTAALVPEFAVKDLPLGRILMTMIFWATLVSIELPLHFSYQLLSVSGKRVYYLQSMRAHWWHDATIHTLSLWHEEEIWWLDFRWAWLYFRKVLVLI